MLIKFVIVGVIVLAGGVLFSNEISQFLPVTSTTIFDSLKQDFDKMKDDSVKNTETRVEGTLVTVTKEVDEIKEKSSDLLSKSAKEVTETTHNGIKGLAESTEKGIKQIGESTQKTILGGSSNQQTSPSNQNTENGNSNVNNNENNSSNPTNSQNNTPNEEVEEGNSSSPTSETPTQTSTENIISYETLSLKTTQQADNSVMLRYEDTSGKTISVSVTLRTTERELFSGTFYSSMFETFVGDASNTAYFIDMIVEHQDHGTIASSVYNPRDSPNTIINGVFSQS